MTSIDRLRGAAGCVREVSLPLQRGGAAGCGREVSLPLHHQRRGGCPPPSQWMMTPPGHLCSLGLHAHTHISTLISTLTRRVQVPTHALGGPELADVPLREIREGQARDKGRVDHWDKRVNHWDKGSR